MPRSRPNVMAQFAPLRTRGKANSLRKCQRTLSFEPLEPKVLLASLGGMEDAGLAAGEQVCSWEQTAAPVVQETVRVAQSVAVTSASQTLAVHGPIELSARSTNAGHPITGDAITGDTAPASPVRSLPMGPVEDGRFQGSFRVGQSGVVELSAQHARAVEIVQPEVTQPAESQPAESQSEEGVQPAHAAEVTVGEVVLIQIRRRVPHVPEPAADAPVSNDVADARQLTSGADGSADAPRDATSNSPVQTSNSSARSTLSVAASARDSAAAPPQSVAPELPAAVTPPRTPTISASRLGRLLLVASMQVEDITDRVVETGQAAQSDAPQTDNGADRASVASRTLLAFAAPESNPAGATATWAELVDATIASGHSGTV